MIIDLTPEQLQVVQQGMFRYYELLNIDPSTYSEIVEQRRRIALSVLTLLREAANAR